MSKACLHWSAIQSGKHLKSSIRRAATYRELTLSAPLDVRKSNTCAEGTASSIESETAREAAPPFREAQPS